jgi:serine/threonine-protein kinase ULK/ATG1
MEYHGLRVPEETAQRIIYCIADAVGLIHSKGIAHRDIKLANILLKNDFQIKLADFGFAKVFHENVLMETYCGTPITMAPEILLSLPYDKKCDVWSLGIILFQLVYGRLPFSIS